MISKKERRDRYIQSVVSQGADLPTDDEIEAVTGYIRPWKRFRGWLIALALGAIYAGISALSR